jgi:hypothetical protein
VGLTGIPKSYMSGKQVRWMMSLCFYSAEIAISRLVRFHLSSRSLIPLAACVRHRCLRRPQDQIPHPRKDKLGTQVPPTQAGRSVERAFAKEAVDRIPRKMDGDGSRHPWTFTARAKPQRDYSLRYYTPLDTTH